MATPVRGTPQRLSGKAWTHFKEFCALGGGASFIWPRWLILRAVGVLYVIIFAGIIKEGAALIGPEGIAPLRETIEAMSLQNPNCLVAFFRAPGLFWISTSPGMIAMLQWFGLIAAVAVVCNVWPRLSLFVCWISFLSFVVTGHFFSATQPDQLMIEVTLLCLPLAPSGFLPGLGVKAAPRRVAIFALRWMLFRLMFEAGLSKFAHGGPLWMNLTAMDFMYETAPFPTVLGYLSHQLPHAFHVLEIAVTFVAEVPAPLLALVGGPRWRWFAFWVWGFFQLGIQLTNNFAWLNLAAIALGLVLIDDQMLVGAARWMKWRRLGDFIAARVVDVSARSIGPWPRWGLRVALGAQFALALFFYGIALGIPTDRIPSVIYQPVDLLFGSLRSANVYRLFGNLQTKRYEVEFMGSNDDGETWRTYRYRYKVQATDRVCPFIAPYYPRFEAILQNTLVSTNDTSLYQAVAAHLLRRDPAVLKLFRDDPFPDRPATIVRMPTYRFTLTDLGTLRETGNYWHKEYQGDYAAPMLVNQHGDIVPAE